MPRKPEKMDSTDAHMVNVKPLVTVSGHQAEDWRRPERPVRLGLVGFILGPKAPIPQEIQFRTMYRNVMPQCQAEIRL